MINSMLIDQLWHHNQAEGLIHIGMAIFGLYGALLFTWWWVRQRSATSVFKYVTFTFWAEAVRASIEAYAELLEMTTNVVTAELWKDTSLLWHIRILPVVLAGFIVIVHMSYRAFVIKETSEERRKRTEDRRNKRNDRRHSDRVGS